MTNERSVESMNDGRCANDNFYDLDHPRGLEEYLQAKESGVACEVTGCTCAYWHYYTFKPHTFCNKCGHFKVKLMLNP
jgi:hypothetical protein